MYSPLGRGKGWVMSSLIAMKICCQDLQKIWNAPLGRPDIVFSFRELLCNSLYRRYAGWTDNGKQTKNNQPIQRNMNAWPLLST